jgi:hypothetical protein
MAEVPSARLSNLIAIAPYSALTKVYLNKFPSCVQIGLCMCIPSLVISLAISKYLSGDKVLTGSTRGKVGCLS